MADDSPNTPRPLIPWFDERIQKPDGSPYGKRGRDKILKKYRIPTVRIGWAEMVIPAQADARIAELARFQEEPPRRGPGRPRTVA